MTKHEKILWQKSHEFIALRQGLEMLCETFDDESREAGLVAINACLQIAIKISLRHYKGNKSEALDLISKTINLIVSHVK